MSTIASTTAGTTGMPALLAALGTAWPLQVPVVALSWSADGQSAAFALGNGQVVVADSHWPQGPRVQPRLGGGVTLVPASEAAARPVRAACHQGSCLALAAHPRGGFVSGGDDGRVVHIPRTAPPAVLSHLPGQWINALACHGEGGMAHAHGRTVHRRAAGIDTSIELPAPATALAFSPDGGMLAASHSGGVTLWPASGAPRLLVWHGYHRALCWSPDGRYLVTALQENALHGWRVSDGKDMEMGGYGTQALSLSFAHDGRYLATSGDARPVCWGFDPPGKSPQPTQCGMASKTPVTVLACHPRQSLIAVGYHNGAVLLCRPGSDEVIFVKGSGEGAVNALAWSGDGQRLAFGTQGGLCGWLGLPDALFRLRGKQHQANPEETTT
jgi:WD40 repeat protein